MADEQKELVITTRQGLLRKSVGQLTGGSSSEPSCVWPNTKSPTYSTLQNTEVAFCLLALVLVLFKNKMNTVIKILNLRFNPLWN